MVPDDVMSVNIRPSATNQGFSLVVQEVDPRPRCCDMSRPWRASAPVPNPLGPFSRHNDVPRHKPRSSICRPR